MTTATQERPTRQKAAKATDEVKQDHPMERVEPSEIKAGDVMMFPYWAHVIRVYDNGERLLLRDLKNNQQEFKVEGEFLIRSAFSADQYQETHKVTGTEMHKVVDGAYHKPVTVVWVPETHDGEPNLAHTERKLRGELISRDIWKGRSLFADMDMPASNRFRWVDNRTIVSLIVAGMKYIVK